MSAFGKVLGASLAVVLVAKVGLTVSYTSDEKHAEQAQNIRSWLWQNTHGFCKF